MSVKVGAPLIQRAKKFYSAALVNSVKERVGQIYYSQLFGAKRNPKNKSVPFLCLTPKQ
ncbi:MAG: hypothetical protein ACI9BG_001186 [Parasphingorhabdus sp.]|jgi:hypothetical protein